MLKSSSTGLQLVLSVGAQGILVLAWDWVIPGDGSGVPRANQALDPLYGGNPLS